MTLVDTNVLVDVLNDDPLWGAWSAERLWQASQAGPLATNLVVYAELHAHDSAGPHIDALLEAMGIAIVEPTRAAGRMAVSAFRAYRQRGGSRSGVLPDFFIGAQAVQQAWPLLTRDAGRYRSYFADIRLICPN